MFILVQPTGWNGILINVLKLPALFIDEVLKKRIIDIVNIQFKRQLQKARIINKEQE